MTDTSKTPPPKKPKYLLDGTRKLVRKGQPERVDYIRAWREGGPKTGEVIVQVWVDKTSPEGEPDGDWAMPAILGFEGCVDQAHIQTDKRS